MTSYMMVENNYGRWVWELLQNAKDSVAENDSSVSVEIELNKHSVVFRYNGPPYRKRRSWSDKPNII